MDRFGGTISRAWMDKTLALREKGESKVGGWRCHSLNGEYWKGEGLDWKSCLLFLNFYFLISGLLRCN